MWTCSKCGEPNEDHFQQCWSCVSDVVRNGHAPKPEEAPPRQLRSLGWILARALIAFVIATVAGLAVFHRNGVPLVEAAASGAILGLVAGGIVGVFVWVAFPYQPGPSTASHEQSTE